ncbi:MAG: hypothetical protein KC448_10930 [Yoonia sp.]|nr:hypothetical protein [Yoonia sp.]
MKMLPLSLIVAALLSACTGGDGLTWTDTPVGAHRFYADNFQDHPFDTGPITVLSEEHGDLRSYTLRSCGADQVCGAGKGRVVRTSDYWVVTGAYAERIFYVSAGGDGWVKHGGALTPIAWN